jgi:hypothetical protein
VARRQKARQQQDRYQRTDRWHNAPDKDDIKRWQSEAWAVERCLGYGRRTRGCGCWRSSSDEVGANARGRMDA